MENEVTTLIQWFELNDGDIFGIQLVAENGDLLEQILMEREIAIEMANDILEMFNEKN
jgi:hypothetical protein